ncbi:MAG TPA: hypothetical protein VFV19_18140 [Candidatus Polarisedimenticolaceae bacterium]|nr:hypothetical protein [Candidatus Polarisedimenticolaceae bacterium]
MRRCGRSLLALSCLVVWVFVTPSLVLCESGNGHKAIEPMTSACCEQGFFGGTTSGSEMSSSDCGDACVDTPLISGAEISSSPSVAKLGVVAVAVAVPCASCSALPRVADARFEPPRGSSSLPTVLRI